MATLRQARPSDAGAVMDVVVAAARAQGPRAYTEAEVAAWSHVEDPPPDYPIGDESAHFVVAEADGTVVGVGDLDREAGEVRAVYVHPDHMHEGIGSMLLGELERVARAEGLSELYLLASLNAVEFYERHGYEREETTTIENSFDVTMDVELMTKGLG